MKKSAIVLFCLMCLQTRAQIVTYSINRNINCTDTVRPFSSNIRSYGISIDGEGQLLSDSAFIRVVLVDNNDNEWLIYERNSLYATEESLPELPVLYYSFIIPYNPFFQICNSEAVRPAFAMRDETKTTLKT